MQQKVKLIVGQLLSGQKVEFMILNNQVVGQGGFGIVKKAIQSCYPDEELVVKIIPCPDEKSRVKIEKEITILRNLPIHPNLVQVQPIKCFSTHNYYIFMEYCKQGSLEDLMLKKKIFEQKEVMNIFYQIMQGYKVLWQRKILHQDLKPDNILIKDKKIKITDFGFSIFHQNFKHTNIRQGTLQYMALQKLTRKQYYANTKSDVFAIGVILFKLIMGGSHPYLKKKASNYRQYINMVQKNNINIDSNLSNKFSLNYQHFLDLVLRMLAKDQSARIDFHQIYTYIENENIFLNKESIKQKSQQIQINKIAKKFVIQEQSSVITIPFSILKQQEQNYINKAKQIHDEKKQIQLRMIRQKLQNYIANNHLIIYFFDRLTRRIYIERIKKPQEELYSNNQQLILGLLLLSKKIIQAVVRQSKIPSLFPHENWKIYKKNNAQLLEIILKDQEYVRDLIVETISQSKKTKIKEQKYLIDLAQADIQKFKEVIREKLHVLLDYRVQLMKQNDKQSLITVQYVINAIDIVCNLNQWLENALQLQPYFRNLETEDCQSLFPKITQQLSSLKKSFTIDLGEIEQ